MEITVRKVTRTTYAAKKRLKTEPCESDPSRGVFYMPHSDEAALSEARGFHDVATKMLRQRAKSDDAPVSLHIDRDAGGLLATCELTTTG